MPGDKFNMIEITYETFSDHDLKRTEIDNLCNQLLALKNEDDLKDEQTV